MIRSANDDQRLKPFNFIFSILLREGGFYVTIDHSINDLGERLTSKNQEEG